MYTFLPIQYYQTVCNRFNNTVCGECMNLQNCTNDFNCFEIDKN